jgi:DNA-directed RNA polymerase specialized sigma54-like protein
MARPRSDDKRTKRIAAPASVRELKDFVSACALVRMEPADTLRKLAEAFIDHVDEHGFVVQPIKLAGPPTPKKS